MCVCVCVCVCVCACVHVPVNRYSHVHVYTVVVRSSARSVCLIKCVGGSIFYLILERVISFK